MTVVYLLPKVGQRQEESSLSPRHLVVLASSRPRNTNEALKLQTSRCRKVVSSSLGQDLGGMGAPVLDRCQVFTMTHLRSTLAVATVPSRRPA